MQKCKHAKDAKMQSFVFLKRQITPKTANRAKDTFFACFFKRCTFFYSFPKKHAKFLKEENEISQKKLCLHLCQFGALVNSFVFLFF
jgi:hypothetical protein